jgi:hypothetical protein
MILSWCGVNVTRVASLCKLSCHKSYPLLPDLYVCYTYLCDAFYSGTNLIKGLW